MATYAIIPAAGTSKRMGAGMNKILLGIGEKPMLAHTLSTFERRKDISRIIIATNETGEVKNSIARERFTTPITVVKGGIRRQDSVHAGIQAIDGASYDDIVIIHNAANPLVTAETITKVIGAAKRYGAAVAGFYAVDTIKEDDGKGFIRQTLDRKAIFQAQTPQAMTYGIAKEAFARARAEQYQGTDDVSLVERLGKKVKLVECPRENIKITIPADLSFAKQVLKGSRVGFGQDSHPFEPDGVKKPLILGGITIPGCSGLAAHSDGDVILHTIFNAISQALGKKSLGHYADPMCKKGITDSSTYLMVILKEMQQEGYAINNLGIMIEGKKPKIDPYADSIKRHIAALCGIADGQIGITATTGEEMTAFGRGEGLQCFAVATLIRT